MCGIFGIYSPVRPLEASLLQNAIDCIPYRGPDDQGIYISSDFTVGLAHKRLSILDLSSAGKQPMCDEEQRFWIVFNGEIYNFMELRDILAADGCRFVSGTDTEVLLYAYRKWGTDCLERLNGMFAFGIYDSVDHTIFLARDRIGKKPLFYSICDGNFIFASELKQLLFSGFVPCDVDPAAVNYYFALGYIPGEKCLVKQVRKLSPGHFLVVRLSNKDIRIKQYWDVPDFVSSKGEGELIDDVESLLTDSVKMRLLSDVPLGAFLSGGVDSSLVVAFMRRIHNGEIKTFSIGFEGSRSSELEYAGLVARHLETTHKEIVIRPNFRDDLEYVSGLLDEPIFDSSILPTYYLSKYTKQDVTVALSGDGGDELFGGYISYQSALYARNIARFAMPPLNLFAGLVASWMPEGSFGKNTLYGIARGGNACFTYPAQIFREVERRKLLSPGLFSSVQFGSPLQYRKSLMERGYDYVNSMCYADIKTGLVDDILVKVDRASMVNSLEVRCPLLDYRIVEYAFRHVPGNLKIKGSIKKYLLKKLANKYLPPELELERKQGFDIPGDMLTRTYLMDRLLSFNEYEFVSKAFVSKLVRAQQAQKGYHWHKLFALYFFLRWLETWKK